ncbi:MAG: hypothetical protein KF893_16100 [Caldilineaceae bacterium]|nr:hypothetical protein [Caldilineaceae bacterium]
MIWHKDSDKDRSQKKQRNLHEWTTPAYHVKNERLETNGASFYDITTNNQPPNKRSRGELLLERRRSIRSFHLPWLFVAPMSVILFLFAAVLVLQGAWQEAFLFLLLAIVVWLPLAILSYTTRYRIYENRIDILTGFFDYREESIWLFQIRDAVFARSRLDWVTNTASVLVTFEMDGNSAIMRKLPLIGLGNIRFMQEFRDELFDVAIQQRYLLKGWRM